MKKNGEVVQGIMRELIVEGQATGEIARDDPDQLMFALMACINGLVQWTPPIDPEKALQHYPDPNIILRMLRPDK